MWLPGGSTLGTQQLKTKHLLAQQFRIGRLRAVVERAETYVQGRRSLRVWMAAAAAVAALGLSVD